MYTVYNSACFKVKNKFLTKLPYKYEKSDFTTSLLTM